MNVASSRWTRRALGVGTASSAACFVVAVGLDLLGRPGVAGDPSDMAALAGSVAGLEAWGWATLGTLLVIATPAASLVATAAEYRAVSERGPVLTALVVLGILGLSLALALLRP